MSNRNKNGVYITNKCVECVGHVEHNKMGYCAKCYIDKNRIDPLYKLNKDGIYVMNDGGENIWDWYEGK